MGNRQTSQRRPLEPEITEIINRLRRFEREVREAEEQRELRVGYLENFAVLVTLQGITLERDEYILWLEEILRDTIQEDYRSFINHLLVSLQLQRERRRRGESALWDQYNAAFIQQQEDILALTQQEENEDRGAPVTYNMKKCDQDEMKCYICLENVPNGNFAVKCRRCSSFIHSTCAVTGNLRRCGTCRNLL